MSLKYLYITQKPDDAYTITIYNTSQLMPGLQHVKYMIPHLHSNPFDVIQNFLTSNGHMYIPNKITNRDSAIINAYIYAIQGRHVPIADLYLSVVPLQTEALLKIYNRVLSNDQSISISNLNSSIEAIIGRLNNIEKEYTEPDLSKLDEKITKNKDYFMSEMSNIRGEMLLLSTLMTVLQSDIQSLKTEINEIKVTNSHRAYINESYFDADDKPETQQTDTIKDDHAGTIDENNDNTKNMEHIIVQTADMSMPQSSETDSMSKTPRAWWSFYE